MLLLFNAEGETWTDALIPKWLKKAVRGLLSHRKPKNRKRKAYMVAQLSNLFDTKDSQIRLHMYRQIFYVLDINFDSTISIDEFESFGEFLSGHALTRDELLDMMDETIGLDAHGEMTFEMFCFFCETHMKDLEDIPFTTKKLQGFLDTMKRKSEKQTAMWQARAACVDDFAQWAVPPGFIFFMSVVFSMSEEQFKNMSSVGQNLLYTSGALIFLLVSTVYLSYHCWQMRRATWSENSSYLATDLGFSSSTRQLSSVLPASQELDFDNNAAQLNWKSETAPPLREPDSIPSLSREVSSRMDEKSEHIPQEPLSNLLQRFPNRTLDQIKDALSRSDGHAGRAAMILRGMK